MARKSSAVLERAAAHTNGKAAAAADDYFLDDEPDDSAEGDSAVIGRVTVDGRDARIVQDEMPLYDDESLDSALTFLNDAKASYDGAVIEAKDALAERRKMQDRLASAVDRVIAAKERERSPELAF